MTGSEVKPLPFHPNMVLHWEKGFIALGIDGEFLELDLDLKPIGEPKRPFPSSIKDAVLVKDTLIATWIEHELMVARMAAFEVGNGFIDGPEKGDLRTRTSIAAALHPAGTVWSHVLDAEPLALGGSDEQFAFMLWKKGMYMMGMDAEEHWRKPEPQWKELERLPYAEVTIELTFDQNRLYVWSRGAGFIAYDSETGQQVDSGTVPVDGILTSVYSTDNQHLLCFEDGKVVWYANGEVRKQEQLNGAIQHALWNHEHQHWHIAGWREECVVSLEATKRSKLNEIPVQIMNHKKAVYVVLNNGRFLHSSLT